MIRIRKAVMEDVPVIAEIYDKIHTQEESGKITIGWDRKIYPTKETAETSVKNGDMFVAIYNDRIVASGKINQEQVKEYKNALWQYKAKDTEVMVLHTLTVDPEMERKGIATAFLKYYEEYAKENGCPYLRIDTNEKNERARIMYQKFEYKEVGIVDCVFNGIQGVKLVCLEKYLDL